MHVNVNTYNTSWIYKPCFNLVFHIFKVDLLSLSEKETNYSRILFLPYDL